MLSAIVATDINNCIGINGELPWDYPSDRKFFKEYVRGKLKLMGRKTWESIKKYKWADG